MKMYGMKRKEREGKREREGENSRAAVRRHLAERAVALDLGDHLVQEHGRDHDAGAGAVRGGEDHGDERELHFFFVFFFLPWVYKGGYIVFLGSASSAARYGYNPGRMDR